MGMLKWQIETQENTEDISLNFHVFHVFFSSPGGTQSLQVTTKSSQRAEMVEMLRSR